MVIDNGCDQSIINNNAFFVKSFAGVLFNVGGALHGMRSSSLELVNEAYTIVTLPDSTRIILELNQCFLDRDPLQTEALLQPHQARAFGVIVDDCSSAHLGPDGLAGGQCLTIAGVSYPMHFDGWKCYLRVSKPTDEDLQKYPIIRLTSPLPYEPQTRRSSRRLPSPVGASSQEWRARLGFPTLSVTEATLEHTTNMVQTLRSETQDYMRDHHSTRVWALRPRRIDDVCYSDTFFSSVVSIRKFKCFQMFAYKQSSFEKIILMKRESEAPAAYEDVIRSIGAPNKMVTDNAKVCTGIKWTTISRRFCIESGLSVPHHQHQNYAENCGGNFKLAVLRLLHHTPHAPLCYWCFAAEFLDKVRGYWSKPRLSGASGIQALRGETPDISRFRFYWFQPIWYYDASLSFPHDRMEPGFFLDLAENTGDGFSFLILPAETYEDIPLHKRPVTLVRSVVRPRLMDDSPTAVQSLTPPSFTFMNRLGEDLVGNEQQTDNSSSHISISSPDPNLEEPTPGVPVGIPDLPIAPTLIDFDSIPSSPAETPSTTPTASLLSEPISVPNDPVTSEESPTPDDLPPELPFISQTQDDDESVNATYDHVAESTDPHNHSTLISQLNNEMDDTDDFQRVELDAIISHRITNGILELAVKYTDGIYSWHPIELCITEDAQAVANYVLISDLGKTNNDRYGRWARKFLRSLKRTLRRLRRCNFFGFTSSSYRLSSKRCRRGKELIVNGKKVGLDTTPNSKSSRPFKYGFEVPQNWSDILRLDAANGNRKWQDAVMKEVAALLFHKCFDFKSPDYKPSSEYQFCRLHFVYDVKPDLRFKARLVCDGSRVDPKGLDTRATVVKGISVRLLDVIADSQSLSVLCGDVGNAFIQAMTKEKIYTRCGAEFGDRQGSIAVIIRALYGLTTSAERFHTLFSDFLRSLGFEPTRYDRDVWMRLRDDSSGYDYICTHVDDFKIVAKDPQSWIERLTAVFLIKSHGPRDYYLGCNYKYHDTEKMWTYGCQTYCNEAIERVERIFGSIAKESTPLPVDNCHPETDTSPLLDLAGHRQFQMLLGMIQWLVTIGKPDLCAAVTSLNRFAAAPRERHLELAIRVFGYIKTVKDKNIAIDSRPLVQSRTSPDFTALRPDFLKDYPNAVEEIDPSFPRPFGDILQTTILVDSDHAHDLVTRKSITGLLAYVGSTPVLWYAKRQGSIASSTYAAEFSALRTATEEAFSLRYMLRCLGCNLPAAGKCPTRIFGDNLSVILNAQNPACDLSKKHVAISYNVVREAIAAGITECFWLKGRWNLSDIMTKQIPRTPFKTHCDHIFWRPDFHFRTTNRLDEDTPDSTF